MMSPTLFRRLLVILIAAPSVSLAQYSRTPGDTVRLREITSGVLSFMGPSGVVEIRSEHDGSLSVAFGAADSARAWYDALTISTVSPQGRNQPATRAALGLAFSLLFDERGRIETLRSPQFPSSFEGVTDLSLQFADLFPVLPAGPLAVGRSWQDTLTTSSTKPNGDSMRATRIIQARVLRDTVVAGEKGFLVALVQMHTLESVAKITAQRMVARSYLTGPDSGFFVFSHHGGRLLSRTRVTTLTGSVTYEGAAQPNVFQIRQRFTNRVEVLR